MKKRGFTLIEVLFVAVLVAVLLAAIYPYLRTFYISWQSTDRRSEVIQNARIGMDKMVKEFRQAGNFISLQNSVITFIDVDNNSITYRLNAGNLERNSVILAGPVSDLSFTYYDVSGIETDVTDDVELVKISLTVSDSEGAVNPLSLASAAFIRSSPEKGIRGEGHKFSKNSDFSTEDATFSTSDIFYIKAWSNQIAYEDIMTAEIELKKGETSIIVNLTNNEDGTYTGSQDLGDFDAGNWKVTFHIEDNDGNKYDVIDWITVE
ncbi:MAG: prepilin-type N-terminal cleavage/methylation domain-containing protein [Candidatus Omnitrophica bacterium]|nr:prepilin-type N-terminal cleavage/methylation domain-containing protein [Candidatus Omnitrophota bacterium]